jgi:hypothetical protein
MKINNETLERVRKWYHHPALKEPTIEPELYGGAHFDFKTGETKIGEGFVRKIIEKTKVTEEQCLEGLLTHEIGHYMVFPRTLGKIILSGKMLDDFFDENQNFMFQTYADMANDLASVVDSNKKEPILRMRKASQETLSDDIDKNIRELMLAYLNIQAGNEYKLKPELDSYLERIKKIEFLDPKTYRSQKNITRFRLSLHQWGDIVNDMIKKYKGEPKTSNETNIPGDIDLDKIIKNASVGDIRRALREISEEVSRGEYKRVKIWLKDKEIELPGAVLDKPYITIGTEDSGTIKVSPEVVFYYKELSRQYPIIVHKKPIKSEKTKKSFEETEKWKVGKEPLLAMPNQSGGFFLPGITRKIKIKKRNIITTDYDIPHLLVSMDSSASMPEPESRKSYAVLAACCAARSYHIRNSAIGVINFSGRSLYLPYTRDLDQALYAITAYQGGGTTVDLDMLKKMLDPLEFRLYQENPEANISRIPREAVKKDIQLSLPSFKKALESGSIDLLMFTDGGISNLEDIISYFQEIKTLNRATIVLTGNYPQSVPETGNKINIHKIENEKDIPNIVIKDIRRNMDYNATRYAGKI